MPEVLSTDERAALYYIAALIKNYEPQFELQGNFTPGLFSHSDPHYPAVRKEWLHALVRNGHLEKKLLSIAEAEDDLMDYGSDEADSRLNWRITFQHAFYLIHIMALDKTFQRFEAGSGRSPIRTSLRHCRSLFLGNGILRAETAASKRPVTFN